jgi:hypothetical protein
VIRVVTSVVRLVLVAATTITAATGCINERARASFELGQPQRVQCNCRDSFRPLVCTAADACVVAQSDECDAACALHGGLTGFDCSVGNNVSCLLGTRAAGANALVCMCNGERDGGGCTSLDCTLDVGAVESVCDAFCTGAGTADDGDDGDPQPLCAPSPSCVAGGPPPGRDRFECECGDGSIQGACTSGLCGNDAVAVCDTLCVDNGGAIAIVNCLDTDVTCALNLDPSELVDVDVDVEARRNAVSCNCDSSSNLGACTALDCDDDREAIARACEDACAVQSNPPGSAAPVCVEEDASCVDDSVPSGDDFWFCHCVDDVFFSFCTAGCRSCDGVCDDHGGLSDRIVEGCSQSELVCLADGDDTAPGGPNAIGCRCGGEARFVTRCGDVDCDEPAALEAVCADACFGAAAEATCIADDAGCVVGAPASGPFLSACTCGDGTRVTTCVADCNDSVGVVGLCFTECHDRGGFTGYDCSTDDTCT